MQCFSTPHALAEEIYANNDMQSYRALYYHPLRTPVNRPSHDDTHTAQPRFLHWRKHGLEVFRPCARDHCRRRNCISRVRCRSRARNRYHANAQRAASVHERSEASCVRTVATRINQRLINPHA